MKRKVNTKNLGQNFCPLQGPSHRAFLPSFRQFLARNSSESQPIGPISEICVPGPRPMVPWKFQPERFTGLGLVWSVTDRQTYANSAEPPTGLDFTFCAYVIIRVFLNTSAASHSSGVDNINFVYVAQIPNMSCEMVRSAESSHANSTLERLLSGVDSDMSSKLIRARKPPVAVGHRTRIWALVHRCLAWTVGIFARAHRH